MATNGELMRIARSVAEAAHSRGTPHVAGVQLHQVDGLEMVKRIRLGFQKVCACPTELSSIHDQNDNSADVSRRSKWQRYHF